MPSEEQSPNALERVRLLLTSALRLPPDRRIDFIREECGSDSNLAAEVEDLLSFEEASGEFLNLPLPEQLGLRVRGGDLTAGALLNGRYRVEQLLARSGFATVYLASDESVAGKRVVLKVPDAIHGKQVIEHSVKAEVQSLARINHPNVVGISDFGYTDGTPFLVLNYVPGATLRSLLSRGPLPVAQTRRVMAGIGKALAAAHEASVLHLDIKPENVIVSALGGESERITLIDFGIACLKGGPDRIVAASPRYMAPEQNETPTVRSDIYSLGLIAFETLTGRLPDFGRRIESQLPRTVGRYATRAIARAVSADPQARFATAEEFTRQLCFVPRRTPRLALSATAATALAFALVANRMWRNQPPGPGSSRPVPVVATAGSNYQPSFSPDGSSLFYVSGPAGHRDIYRKAVPGGQAVSMVASEGDDEQPQISPDASTLVFVQSGGSGIALMLKDIKSGAQTELSRAPAFEGPSWSSDGKMLAISQGDSEKGVRRLRTVALPGRTWRDLETGKPPASSDERPVVSPDGRLLAFARLTNAQSSELYVMDVDRILRSKGLPRRITNDNARIESLQWTPDSKELIYLAGPVGNGALWRIAAVGGSPAPVLPDVSRIEKIAIPRHAWKLAYSVHLSDANIWRIGLSRRNARPLEPLVEGPLDDEEPSLSPDGTRIAFSSQRSGEEQVWVKDKSGTRQISSFASPDGVGALWTRDSGTLLLSVRSKELGERIYRTVLDGPPRLTELMGDAAAESLSRDGRRLYIRKRVGNLPQIWRADYPTMKHLERAVEGEASFARESPDGRFLYYSKLNEKDGIWRQTLPHGESVRVVDRVYRRSLFAPGKRGLYYISVAPANGAKAALVLLDPSGSRRQLATFDHEIFWGFDLAEDEGSLLFSQYDSRSSAIMLIEHFR